MREDFVSFVDFAGTAHEGIETLVITGLSLFAAKDAVT